MREWYRATAVVYGATAQEGELYWAMTEWAEGNDARMTDERFRMIGMDPRRMRHRKVDRVFWLGEMYNALIARSRNPAAVSRLIYTHSDYVQTRS